MERVQTKNCVLDMDSINRKIRRMAFEIAERNIDEDELIIAGIQGNGELVAGHLTKELLKIRTFQITPVTIRLNKKDPRNVFVDPPSDIENKVIIIVDDVANTGKTMLFALKPFLEWNTKKIQTLALVERSHKLFPIQTDYTGLSITTTLQEHISVETENDNITGAWLF